MAKQLTKFNDDGTPTSNPADQPKSVQEAAHDVPGAPAHYPEHARITQEETEGKIVADEDKAAPQSLSGLPVNK